MHAGLDDHAASGGQANAAVLDAFSLLLDPGEGFHTL